MILRSQLALLACRVAGALSPLTSSSINTIIIINITTIIFISLPQGHFSTEAFARITSALELLCASNEAMGFAEGAGDPGAHVAEDERSRVELSLLVELLARTGWFNDPTIVGR